MAVANRSALLLVLVLALSPAIADARRHVHGHGGWVHARIAMMRGWFRRAAHDAPVRPARRAPGRSDDAARQRAEAALAARRRGDVEAYLRDHPVFASAQ